MIIKGVLRAWRQLSLPLLAMVCLLAAAACVNTRGDRPGDLKASTAAVAITYQLASQHFSQVYARFNPALQKALTQAQLAKLWQGFESKYGSFDSASAVENRQHGVAATDVVVACHFLKGTQFLVWTLANANLQVTGLHLAGGA